MAESSIDNRRPAAGTVVAFAAVFVLMAGTLSLWAFYGTAVFFEVIRAGWMACF